MRQKKNEPEAQLVLAFNGEQTRKIINAMRKHGGLDIDGQKDNKLYCCVKYAAACVIKEFGEEDSLGAILKVVSDEFKRKEPINIEICPLL